MAYLLCCNVLANLAVPLQINVSALPLGNAVLERERAKIALPFLIASARPLSLAASVLPINSKAEKVGIAVLETPTVDGLDLLLVELREKGIV